VAGLEFAEPLSAVNPQAWAARFGSEAGDAAARLIAPLAHEPWPALDEPFEAPPEEPADLAEWSAVSSTFALQPAGPAGGATASQTSLYLAGSVHVSVFLPESTGELDANQEDWTAAERDAVLGKVEQALLWMAEAEPAAELTFVVEAVDAPVPGGLSGTVATRVEAIRRIEVNKGKNFPNPLMNELADAAGMAPGANWLVRFREFVHQRRVAANTNWAFAVVVVDNSNAQWGRASAFVFGPVCTLYGLNGANVFRHEFGHIFGARDEYHPDAAQSPSGLAGVLAVANGNSQFDDGTGYVDGQGESLPSLMLNNTSQVSTFARGQFGWMDHDGDGVLDLLDQPPSASGAVVTVEGVHRFEGAVAARALEISEPYIKQTTTLDAVRAARARLHRLGQGALAGPWMPVEPTDGSFDEATEAVWAELPPLPPGNYALEIEVETFAGQRRAARLPTVVAVAPLAGPSSAVWAGLSLHATPVVGAPSLLDASSSVLVGQGAPMVFSWDLDGDGEAELDTGAVPQVEWTPALAEVANLGVRVQAGELVGWATLNTPVLSAVPPPDSSFVAQVTEPVGAGTSTTVIVTPAGPSTLLGRWDVGDDGVWDTGFEPLAPRSFELPIPTLRVATVGSYTIPGGRSYKAVWGEGQTAVYGDVDRGSLVVLSLADPAKPAPIAALEAPWLTAFSEIEATESGLVVSAGAQGLMRLTSTPEWSLQPLGGAQLTEARGLEALGPELLAVADGSGLALVSAAGAGSVLASIPHLAGAAVVDVAAIAGTNLLAVVAGEAGATGELHLVAWAPTSLTPMHVVKLTGGALASNPVAVTANGDGLVVVSDRSSGFHVVDALASPPAVRARREVEGQVWDTRFSPDGLLMVASLIQLHVFDLSTPNSPQLVAEQALRFPRSLHFDTQGRMHWAASAQGYQLAEVLDAGPHRSRSIRLRLEVSSGQHTASTARVVTALAYDSPPIAQFTATQEAGTLVLDASASSDPDTGAPWESPLRYRWDLDADGAWETPFTTSATYSAANLSRGSRTVRLEVRDRYWARAQAELTVCLNPEPERCGNAIDDDCNGQIDETAAPLGAPCATSGDGCGGAGIWLCHPESGEVFCAQSSGLGSPEQCGNGVDDDCDGQTDEGFVLLGQPCAAGVGGCEQVGTFVCPAGVGTAVVCSAVPLPPSQEVCDGIDNDCDGTTDLNLTELTVPCDGPDPGTCATGTLTCEGGVPVCTESAGVKLPEYCDQQDNDCDGLTDEIFALLGKACDWSDADSCKNGVFGCRPDGSSVMCFEDGPGLVELCNGVDDDCDGQTDEGFQSIGAPCDGSDADVCKGGTFACSADGAALECQEAGPSKVELCNGLDDDCDGLTDEGYGPIGAPCDGDDLDGCTQGVLSCAADGASAVCLEDGPSAVELCNYVDDDCDGEVDETFPGLGAPCDGPDSDACPSGWIACSASGAATHCVEQGPAIAELCNGEDDDCDGEIDENFAVGKPCDGPDVDFCAHGLWICAPSGASVVCAAESLENLVEKCDGLDNDCDGITDEPGPAGACP
jgi:hypothetical protein